MLRRHFLTSSLAFTLGACTTAATRSSQGTDGSTLVFWTMQLKPTFDEYMATTIAAFEQANPGVTIEWVDVPWGEMENKVLTAIAAKTGPDVVNLNPQFATKLAEKNALVDVTPLVAAEAQSDYFPNIWKANTLGETTFGLPWYVATDVTVYNRQLFEQAGLDPNTPPQTYADLAEVAATLKAQTGKHAFMPTLDGAQVLESMVQMGMELVTLEGAAGFDTDAGRAAFDYWVSAFTNELVPREMLTESHRRALELYQAGELAMVMTGPQLFRQISDNAPDIAKVSDIASQISGPSGVKSASVMNLAVTQQSMQANLALDFALFVTNSQNQLAFSKIANTLPSTISTTNDSYFSAAATTPLDKARVVSAEQLPQSEVLIPPIEGLDDLREAIYDELQLAMLGSKSVEAAVMAAANRWNQLA